MDKNALRARIREQKRALTPAQIESASRRLTALLLRHPAYQNAGSIYGYLSYNQEVRTHALLQQALQDGKRVAVPRVEGDRMRFYWLEDLSKVAPGCKGIPEPYGTEPVADDPEALVLMPGLAFDAAGHRIGYGGGYYDKFLAEQPHPTVALCYDFQLLPQLKTEDYDIPVDIVLSTPIDDSEVTL